jgi:hypothetical protein
VASWPRCGSRCLPTILAVRSSFRGSCCASSRWLTLDGNQPFVPGWPSGSEAPELGLFAVDVAQAPLLGRVPEADQASQWLMV